MPQTKKRGQRQQMLQYAAQEAVKRRQEAGRPQTVKFTTAGINWRSVFRRLFRRREKARGKREKGMGKQKELATLNTKLKEMDRKLANWDILQSVPEIGPGGHTKPVSVDTLVARRKRLVASRDSLATVIKNERK